jgi:hypothetical protein
VADGDFLLRACVVNFRTTRADVEAIPAIVDRVGAAVDADLRGRMAPQPRLDRSLPGTTVSS